MNRLEKSVSLLRALNVAREERNYEWAAELDALLEAHDRESKTGFSRSKSIDYGKPVPKDPPYTLRRREQQRARSAK